MRFAAIADVHGNHLALEAVLADIRAAGISEIVNLGDMASGPLEARRAMDALMALDAVHVLGNHDRWLIDRPVERMGSWERPAHAQLGIEHFDWLRTVPATQVFRDQVFLCHATPADDNVYWLETVMPDGSVRMSPLEAIEKAAEGIPQPLILCAHTHIARGAASRRTPGGQSRQHRRSRLFLQRSVPAFDRGGHARRPLCDSRIVFGKLARDLPACAIRQPCDGGTGATERRRRICIRAFDGMDPLNSSYGLAGGQR